MDSEESGIPGLRKISLKLHFDPRGWFKENWRSSELPNEGIFNFVPVQNNVSFNREAGTTRGLHAEPWDKLISISKGRAFCAWVDLREGASFGKVWTTELGPGETVFVPRGIANGYQTLEPDTVYSYLVNGYWSANAHYTMVNLSDPLLGIKWPLGLTGSLISDKDQSHPTLGTVQPIKAEPDLVIGAGGQVGSALRSKLKSGIYLTRDQLDLTSEVEIGDWQMPGVKSVVLAAAYTDVNAAEENVEECWTVNALAVERLVKKTQDQKVPFIYLSTDYVYADMNENPHLETDAIAPMSVYASSKLAGEIAARSLKNHYIIRTSWVFGDGKNFVRTVASMAKAGLSPEVVIDQVGRPTSSNEIASFVDFILASEPPNGTYNVSCSGDPVSWFELAQFIFDCLGADKNLVKPISSKEYSLKNPGTAKRPSNSLLSLKKAEAIGFTPSDWKDEIRKYLERI